ncbi:MAG: nitroreductase family protein [Methanobacteriota archaeon]|nr:MAG: nitroreductase family protein [Euryarchaeota archaeon]
MTNSILDVMRKRRSIRKYEEKEVPRELIDKILTAAFFSPSASNRRPWHFVLVTEKDTIEKLSRARDGSSRFASGAPLVIVVCADSEIAGRWIEDSSISAIMIQLMVTELRLGSCWIHIRDSVHSEDQTAEEYAREVLGIPSTIRVLCMVATGYPAQDKSPHEDSEFMSERVHWEAF